MIANFFRLIRWPNLLIVAFTQFIMRYLIIEPILMFYGMELQLSNIHFSLLVVATVFITAAGYVINDYFDIHTDEVNHPRRVIVGKDVTRRTAIIWHSVLNVLGILIGTYISFHIKVPVLALTFVLASGILWFYSTTYKRQLLLGNLVVAVLTALVPLLVVLYEMPVIKQAFILTIQSEGYDLSIIFYWVAGFSLFAFVLTLIREIVKDIEDFEGDKAFGRQTLPIVLGSRNTSLIVSGLTLFTIVALGLIYYKFLMYNPQGNIDYISLTYIGALLVIPLILLIILLIVAKQKRHYTFASLFTKIIMLSGLLYAFVFRYIVMSSI